MACCRTWTICICTNGVLDTPSLLIILSNILYIILSTREYGYGVWDYGYVTMDIPAHQPQLKKAQAFQMLGNKAVRIR